MANDYPTATEGAFTGCPAFIPLFASMKQAIENTSTLPKDLPHPLPAITPKDIECHRSVYPDGSMRLDFGINGIYVTTQMHVPEEKNNEVALNTAVEILRDFNNDVDTFNTMYPKYLEWEQTDITDTASLNDAMRRILDSNQLLIRTRNLAAIRWVMITRDLFEGLPTHSALFSIKTSGIGTRIFYLDQCVARVTRFADYVSIVPTDAPVGERYANLAPDADLLAYYIDEVVQAQARAAEANAQRIPYHQIDPTITQFLSPLLFAAEQVNIRIW